jgi:hypothetical protein
MPCRQFLPDTPRAYPAGSHKFLQLWLSNLTLSAKIVLVLQITNRCNMSRLGFFLLAAGLLTVGCAHNNPPQAVAPPPGYYTSPPPGAVVAPAPSPGCSSCQGSNPVVNAPHYSPPMPAAPPLTSSVPNQVIVNPVNAAPPAATVASAPPVTHGPIQAAFKPSIPFLESAKLGIVQAEDAPTIPVPPTDAPEAQITSTPAKS